MLRMSKLLLAGALFSATNTHAATPVYESPGTPHQQEYEFKAASDGDLVATFVGAAGYYRNILGVIANGVDLGGGLSNKNPVGTSYNFGPVAAGTSLTFYIDVLNIDTAWSTDLSANIDGMGHVYATNYEGDIDLGSRRPVRSLYLGFEDKAGGGDKDYDDAQFVVTNATLRDAVPEPAVWGTLILGFGMVGIAARRRPVTS